VWRMSVAPCSSVLKAAVRVWGLFLFWVTDEKQRLSCLGIKWNARLIVFDSVQNIKTSPFCYGLREGMIIKWPEASFGICSTILLIAIVPVEMARLKIFLFGRTLRYWTVLKMLKLSIIMLELLLLVAVIPDICYCEHDYEYLCSIKGGEFLFYLSDCQLLKEAVCSMESDISSTTLVLT
jgi:hypothetical protein